MNGTSIAGTSELPVSEPGPWSRFLNLWGTYRRLHLHLFHRGYVRRSHARRRGECNRCGLCCQLVVRCAHLRFENGLASCGCYGARPPNCINFPINRADIADVHRLTEEPVCGYRFEL